MRFRASCSSLYPYALRAADADTVGGQPASTFVRSRADGRLETDAGLVAQAAVDGSGVPGQLAKFSGTETLSSSVISESATNRVGLGLPDPTGGGVVDSVFTIRNFDNNTGFGVLNQTQQRRFALNTLASGGWKLYDGGSGTWNEGLTQLNGRVGLGHNTPDARLRVVSTVGVPTIFASTTAAVSQAFAIRAEAPANATAIAGFSSGAPPSSSFPAAGAAVWGYASGTAAAVQGNNVDNGYGVLAFSATGTALFAQGGANAAQLQGNVTITGNATVSGTLSKGGGSFKIDHPLDPSNKYLSHSFVESPDMMNVYNGNATLDGSGDAWITLPDWFEALNREFRYQLTAIGAPGPNLYVATKVTGNRFKIGGGAAGGEVSWQITGIRKDAWANAHRIRVEEEKPSTERGSYLHPKEHGQPEWAAPASDGLASLPGPIEK